LLVLRGLPLTDGDFEPLQSLSRLSQLDVTGTGVTEQGLAALRAALPQCEVVSEQVAGEPVPDDQPPGASAE
jgi:hypothetical protein